VSSRPLVLCADDDEDILDLVGLRLELAGYEVEKVGDGDAALAAARRRPPAVAVLDVMMPRLSGLEVLSQLRTDPELAEVKVILLSARVQEADVDLGFDAGADAYLKKPFKATELLGVVESLLARADD
jgi:DNA-binding response OmpR family regulator